MSNESTSQKTPGNDPRPEHLQPGNAETNAQQLPGGVTQQQLSKWKEQHQEVHQLQVHYQGETYTCYLKNPTRDTIAFAMSKEHADRPLESGEAFLENCWLEGDKAINEDDYIHVAAAMKARGVFRMPATELKKM